jgi:hypothetical protein
MSPSGEVVQRRGRRLVPTSSFPRDQEDGASSVGTPRSVSPPDDEAESSAVLGQRPSADMSRGKSLRERSKIPPSFVVTFGTILGLQCCSGMWHRSTLDSWYTSLRDSTVQLGKLTTSAINVTFGMQRATTTDQATDELRSWIQYAQTVLITIFCGVLAYVFFVAPALAGLWTGRKARRAVLHRYMGLSYLIHYVLACVELITNYGAAKNSYLCHVVAVTGRSWPVVVGDDAAVGAAAIMSQASVGRFEH